MAPGRPSSRSASRMQSTRTETLRWKQRDASLRWKQRDASLRYGNCRVKDDPSLAINDPGSAKIRRGRMIVRARSRAQRTLVSRPWKHRVRDRASDLQHRSRWPFLPSGMASVDRGRTTLSNELVRTCVKAGVSVACHRFERHVGRTNPRAITKLDAIMRNPRAGVVLPERSQHAMDQTIDATLVTRDIDMRGMPLSKRTTTRKRGLTSWAFDLLERSATPRGAPRSLRRPGRVQPTFVADYMNLRGQR